MSTAIIPEILDNEVQPLEDSPMTPVEQRKLLELETRIKTKLGNKMEADLAIGAALLAIQRERLYRGDTGGRKWEDYLKQESHRLTPDGSTIKEDTAARLRGFYYFREEVLSGSPAGRRGCQVPLPTSAYQVRPLLSWLDHLQRENPDPRRGTRADRDRAEQVAIEIWKAACSDAGKGKVPTFDQVNRARLANEAAELHRLRGSASATPPPQPPRIPPQPPQTPPQDHSPDSKPFIPTWELEQTDDTVLDAADECKRISQAINNAHKAIGELRGILYSRINEHGSDYLVFLRQADAGVYSINQIDEHVQQMGEDIAFITELLNADVGEGELASSTVTVDAFPVKA